MWVGCHSWAARFTGCQSSARLRTWGPGWRVWTSSLTDPLTRVHGKQGVQVAVAATPASLEINPSTLTLFRPHGQLAAAEQIAASLAQLDSLEDVVVIGGDSMLDEALAHHGLPRLGFLQRHLHPSRWFRWSLRRPGSPWIHRVCTRSCAWILVLYPAPWRNGSFARWVHCQAGGESLRHGIEYIYTGGQFVNNCGRKSRCELTTSVENKPLNDNPRNPPWLGHVTGTAFVGRSRIRMHLEYRITNEGWACININSRTSVEISDGEYLAPCSALPMFCSGNRMLTSFVGRL